MYLHILGLGSIGVLAAHLLRTAFPVLNICSLPRLPSPSPTNYTLRPPNGTSIKVLDIIDDSGQKAPIELLLVITKAHHTRSAIELYVKRITNRTLSFFLQNGMGSVDSVRDILATTRIVLGTTTHAVKRTQRDLTMSGFSKEKQCSRQSQQLYFPLARRRHSLSSRSSYSFLDS